MKYARNIILATALVLISFGVYLAFLIGGLPKLEIYKLLNITGLLFNIFGVLILSDFIFEKSERFSGLFDYIFAFSMLALILIPMGIFLGLTIGAFFNLPSSKSLSAFAGGIMLYVGVPLYATDILGDSLKLNFYRSIKFRTKFLGWYFIISGFIFQFIAALKDLIN